MNKNYECDIAKDLAIPYIENLINSKSKIFVEEHLKDCENCKKYYKDINSNILDESKNQKKKENKELDFLKKVRKNMNILKISLIAILIIIGIIILGSFIKCQQITKIVDESYNKIEYLKTLDNYKLSSKTKDINYIQNNTVETTANYYYKSGKYKFELGDTDFYYEDNSNNKICVYNDIKQIDYYTQNFIESKKGEPFEQFSEIISYKNELPGLFKLMLVLRTDKFNGRDCYVIRNGNDKSYKDVWIDKETKLVLRIVEEEDSKYYREIIYTFIQNQVTDEDVNSSVLETDKYEGYIKKEVKYNATKEIKDILEN